MQFGNLCRENWGDKVTEKISLPDINFKVIKIDTCTMKALLITMMRIREFEENVAQLVQEKKVITPCHLYTGQEAIATGICAALNKDDYVFGNHRSHGHYIAKGGDLRAAMAEIYGRSTGCSHGRGGSMHLCSPEQGIMGTSSIVGGYMAIGVGAALAESIRGTQRISVVFHGDGVPEEGIWHEAANLAGLKHLPVIFVCEHNQYCTHMSISKRRAYDNLSDMAAAHGFKTQIIDGNNVLDVFYAARNAVEKTRNGLGPVFLECKTYRWRGHVGPNYDVDLGLRSEEELKAWMNRCPVKHYAHFLIEQGVISLAEYNVFKQNVKNEIDKAVSFAENSPYPAPEELSANVFKEAASCR